MEFMKQRNAIMEACFWMQKEKLVLGTWGNVSVRLNENWILLTPSKVNYDQMSPQDLVIVDYEGNKVRGSLNATSEMDIHRLIYKNRPDVNAVIHCHPFYSSAACATGEAIPPILEEMTQLLGGEIPITSKYIRAGNHIALAEETVSSLGDKNAVLISNHAPVCCGRDLEEAKLCCQVVEKAAQCYLSIKGKFPVHIIEPNDVALERDRYLYKYGKEHE